MIGKVTLVTDHRPHCANGWAGTKRRPACNYTGGHFCCKLEGHKGRCRCACGASCTVRRDAECPTGFPFDGQGEKQGDSH